MISAGKQNIREVFKTMGHTICTLSLPLAPAKMGMKLVRENAGVSGKLRQTTCRIIPTLA